MNEYNSKAFCTDNRPWSDVSPILGERIRKWENPPSQLQRANRDVGISGPGCCIKARFRGPLSSPPWFPNSIPNCSILSLLAKFAPTDILFCFPGIWILFALEPKAKPVHTSFLGHHAIPRFHEDMSPCRQVDEVNWFSQPLQS